MKDGILLREALVPYIYSNARYAYDEGMFMRGFLVCLPKSPWQHDLHRIKFAAANVL